MNCPALMKASAALHAIKTGISAARVGAKSEKRIQSEGHRCKYDRQDEGKPSQREAILFSIEFYQKSDKKADQSFVKVVMSS